MLTNQQSEMLGILFGDGSMSKHRSSLQIAIAGHKYEDREYLLDYVSPMFRELFGKPLKAIFLKNQNTMLVYAWSKRVATTLHEWGMPFGRKTLSRLVPNVEVKEPCFIRGLFDTDGCVYRKYGPYSQIQFKFASSSLLGYAKECLMRLGFHPTLITVDETKFRFFLSRQAEVDEFFQVIKPKNAKHLERFDSFSRKQSFRRYVHRKEEITGISSAKPYSNNFMTPTSVGRLREP